MTIVIMVAVAVAGFVAGVLVGRANKSKVSLAVAEVKDIVSKIEAKIK